ncbi:DUF7694 domain-containing protein [Sulfobacillus harzensis]|uniref:DUF7694 domain-containing protein n=1 Tax=Sulfobacillus harzensis TaxID=2729629 RepID=A0A7Y0Q365_9FIRM|nr:hypothetical protein [Sulfobacillus harzensis]NMP21874.1 hypothetical protein [Sulfobacillus harzensis]
MKRTAQTAVPYPARRPEVEVQARKLLGVSVRVYVMGECTIFVTTDEPDGWHLSISHPTRYPTWDEVAQARYALGPADQNVVMHLPPEREYVNLHDFCFHLHVERPHGKVVLP